MPPSDDLAGSRVERPGALRWVSDREVTADINPGAFTTDEMPQRAPRRARCWCRQALDSTCPGKGNFYAFVEGLLIRFSVAAALAAAAEFPAKISPQREHSLCWMPFCTGVG